MESFLPKEIVCRKDKQNLIVPQNEWFRSELRGPVLKLLEAEWLTEHLRLVDRRKFRARYLRQPAVGGRIATKDIFCSDCVRTMGSSF